jgi:hypothetical protein
MTTDNRAQALMILVGQDHFAPDPRGLYIGISDEALKSRLNAAVDAAARRLVVATTNGATNPQLLRILKEHLLDISRDELDTEDAEQVAEQFDAMLDALHIDSSDGLLNTWMYGFDPNKI